MPALRICVDVPELERAIAFYTGGLGLTVGRRLGSDWAELLGCPVPIDLVTNRAGTRPVREGAALRDYGRHWTPVHLDFVVDDLDAAVARARGAGAAVELPITEKKWGRIAVLADPFGHGLCLLEMRGRGYDELLGA